MIGRMMISEFSQNKKAMVLKVAAPFIIVTVAGSAGYAGLGLVMLLIFTGVVGAGMSVVKLKITGLYERLIVCPIRKSPLFLEITAAQTLITGVQYLPTLAIVGYFNGPAIIIPAIESLLVVVIIGIGIGTASDCLGDMHLNAMLAVLPLLLATFMYTPVTVMLPFHALITVDLSLPGIFFPIVTLFFLYFLFLFWISHL